MNGFELFAIALGLVVTQFGWVAALVWAVTQMRRRAGQEVKKAFASNGADAL